MYGYNIFHEEKMYSVIRAVQQGKNSHAYIFCGEKGIGRHESAEMIAAALVCQNRGNAPCSECSSCIQAKAHTHPDIIYVKAPEGKKTIGVDIIRKTAEDCFIKPFSTGSKVYIIEGDEMTEQAQNAFLKTLEEPPEYAVFIIISSNTENLLQTILSRCTQISFPSLSSKKIREYITKKYPEEKAVDFLVSYSEGNPGRAEEIINDEEFGKLRENAAQKLSALLSERLLSSYQVADFLEENKENAAEIFNLWIMFIRDMILISEGLPKKIINSDFKGILSELATRNESEKLLFAIKRLVAAGEMLQRYVNLRSLALNLCFSVKLMREFKI